MKIRLFVMLAVLLVAGNCWAAKCTTTATLVYSDNTKWDGDCASTGVPGTGAFANYSGIVASGHALTQDDSRTVYATVVEGSYIQGPGVTTTLAGNFTVGNGAGKDGTFTFGAGSTLALGGFSVTLNNCYLRSNSTAENWAYITGVGTVVGGAVVPAPRQNVDLSYVSVQNNGAFTIPFRPTTGGMINSLTLSHMVFANNGALTFGTAGSTPSTTPRSVQHSDFYDLGGNITFYDTGADPGATTLLFHGNTLVQTATQRSIAFPIKMQVTGNTFDRIYPTSANNGKNITYDGNFSTHRGSASGGTVWLLNQGASATETLKNSYIYSPAAQSNSHGIATGGTAGAPAIQVTDNIFEFLGSEPNIVNHNPNVNIDILRNLVIGSTYNTLMTVGAGTTSGTINIKNNTLLTKGEDATGLFLVEAASSITVGSTVNINSNLVVKTSDSVKNARTATANRADHVVTVISDYNATDAPDVSEAYLNIDTLTGNTANIYSLASPSFIAATRGLAAWGATVGTDGTDTAAITLFQKLNGYNATTKTQSDTPSGVSIAGTATSLLDWVRAGFTPTNAALKGTGESGADIGAVAVQVTSTPARRGVFWSSGSFGFQF